MSSATTQKTETREATHSGKPIRLGDLLVSRGLLTEEQVGQALAYQRKDPGKKLLGEVFVELGFVTPDQVMSTLADTYGLPYVRLNSGLVDPFAFEKLPKDFVQSNNVVPMFCVRNRITVAVHEPTDVYLLDEIRRQTNCDVQAVVSTIGDLKQTIRDLSGGGDAAVIDDLLDGATELSVVEAEVADLSNLEEAGGESPVIKLVNFLIVSAVQEGASDIHIEPDEGALRVRFRVDGRLYEKITPPASMSAAVASRIKIMAALDISERRVPQDGAITVAIDKRQVDLRVSTIPGKFGEKVCMRVVDKGSQIAGLDDLGFSPKMLERWRDLVHQPNGIVLVTGPTGSGKSTTLYATLAEINEETVNISTVEDPVEYNLKGINQFQTNNKAGFTFASALRSLLRQDPDIVMVGEIRDQETGRIATQAALTGHLVFSTLHTNDAPSSLTRLFNIGIEPYLVAASVRGILAQRLVRRVCSHCAEEVEPDPKWVQGLQRLRPDLPVIEKEFRGKGCKRCRGTGYKGRVGLYELYAPGDDEMDAVSQGASLQEIRKLALQGDYTTLLEDGLDKVRQGKTTLEELFSVAAG